MPPSTAVPNRPMSLADSDLASGDWFGRCRENSHGHVLGRYCWPSAFCSTCCSTVSISASACCSRLTRNESQATRHDGCGRAGLGRQRDLARSSPRVILWGAFPARLCDRFSPRSICRCSSCWPGLILRGVAFEYRTKTKRMRWFWDAELHRRIVRRVPLSRA